jgi:hypothetical protein
MGFGLGSVAIEPVWSSNQLSGLRRQDGPEEVWDIDPRERLSQT